jgi:hypothetical protein
LKVNVATERGAVANEKRYPKASLLRATVE